MFVAACQWTVGGKRYRSSGQSDSYTRLGIAAIIVDSRKYALSSLDPRWLDQLINLGFEPSSPPASTGAWDWVTEAEKDRRKTLVVAIEALDLLLNLPDIPLLISPPGDKAALKHRTPGHVRAAHHGVDDPYAEAKTLSI